MGTIGCATRAAQHTQNWEAHRPHSQPDVGRGVRSSCAADDGVPSPGASPCVAFCPPVACDEARLSTGQRPPGAGLRRKPRPQ